MKIEQITLDKLSVCATLGTGHKTKGDQKMIKHIDDCTRVFKNYDPKCKRCDELKNGAKPRAGWQKSYFENKKQNEERFTRQLKNHNCEKSNCGVICTAFDW